MEDTRKMLRKVFNDGKDPLDSIGEPPQPITPQRQPLDEGITVGGILNTLKISTKNLDKTIALLAIVLTDEDTPEKLKKQIKKAYDHIGQGYAVLSKLP